MSELMKPRYIIEAPYPGCVFNVGNILYYDDERDEAGYWYSLTESGVRFYVSDPHLYPHLFRKLSWWEHRKPEEMPEYVKENEGTEYGSIIYVYKRGKDFKYLTGINCIGLRMENDKRIINFEYLIPATLEDFTTYNNK